MRDGRIFRAIALVALFAAIGVALPACGGGSGGSPGSKNSQDIFVQKMLLIDQLSNTDPLQPGPPTYNDIGGNGTTNAFRDSKILFVFNAAVDFSSVNKRTLRVGIPTGNNLLVEAPGRFEPVAKKPNWVLFNPTYKTEYDPTNGNLLPDNPFGLDGNAVYSIIVPAFGYQNVKSVLRNRAGDPIVKTFLAEFETSNDYIQTYTQPELVETNPLDGAIEVDATADVDLTFSEAMKPSSFRLGDTVIIRNLDTGRNVLGTLRFSADAKTVSFRPIFGYGPGPYDIFVRVKTDVTNLSGNHIPKEVRLQFRTQKDENVATLIDIRETFDTNTYEDRSFPTAEPLAAWNGGGASGLLAGLYGTGTVTVKATINYLWPPWAWGTNYTGQFQCFWKGSEMGGSPRTMTGFSWYYQASQAASTVTNVTINLGHHDPGVNGNNQLTTTFVKNWLDTPVTVVNNQSSYSIPQNTATGSWLAGPPFTRNFKFNGNDNLLFELICTTDVNGLTNRIINGAWGFNNDALQRGASTQPSWFGGGANTLYYYNFDVRFTWLVSSSEAQSKFYDTGVQSPTYLSALIDPIIAEQPAGTTSSIVFQGAPDDPANAGTPDLLGATEWLDDLTKLSGYRYIRFNIKMTANTSTAQSPAFETLTFPYYFF